jgi:hypothetical protein
MSKIIQIDIEKLGDSVCQRIENLSKKTGVAPEEVIIDMLKRESWLQNFQEANRRLSTSAKNMSEEEILALPRTLHN